MYGCIAYICRLYLYTPTLYTRVFFVQAWETDILYLSNLSYLICFACGLACCSLICSSSIVHLCAPPLLYLCALTLCPRRFASWKSEDKAAVDNLKEEEHAEALRTHAEALGELFFYFYFYFFSRRRFASWRVNTKLR